MNPREVHSTGFNPRQLPTITYTLQNISMSLATMVTSTASFFFTISFILPLSLLRAFIPRQKIIQSIEAKNAGEAESANVPKNKVVLIVGASRGIGFNVLKQYASDPDTVIIAASRSIGMFLKYNSYGITLDDSRRPPFAESLRKAVIELGDTAATIQCAEVDLTAHKKQLVESIKALDRQYGPITHLYEVSGISNHLKDHTHWGLVCRVC